MWMKMIRTTLLMISFVGFSAAWGLSQSTIGQTFASLFFLDGKNVVENTEFDLGLDDIIRFEAYELSAGTTISVKVSGSGIKTVQESYPVNHRGEVKTNFFFPKAKGKLTITVQFTTKNGSPEQIRFYLRPAY